MATSPENSKRLCRKEGCSVSSTGKCLEGLVPEKCPHLQIEEIAIAEAAATVVEVPAATAAPEDSYLTLRDGERLSQESADGVLRRDQTHIIALVAPKD